jgi:Transposase
VAPTGLTRESHAACGLALPGFVEPVRCRGRGLTQQRTDRHRSFESACRPRSPAGPDERFTALVIIGVDPHKRTHTASVVEPGTDRVLATLQIDASLGGYRRLLKWALGFEQRRWAVENARGLGRHLAQWLVARAEVVDDVPSTATARVRELSRGGRRKNDVIDAAAAASVAALRGDANPVVAEDLTTVLALLDERRDNVVTQRTRLINQLHALLRDLLPGGALTDLTAGVASRLLTGVRAAGPVATARKQLTRDLVAEIRDIDQRLKTLSTQIADTLDARTAPDCARSPASARSSGGGCSAGRAARAGSAVPPRSPATPASHRSRSPAATTRDTVCHAVVIGNSTLRCTSSRSPRYVCAGAPVGPTTTRKSSPANPITRRCVV